MSNHMYTFTELSAQTSQLLRRCYYISQAHWVDHNELIKSLPLSIIFLRFLNYSKLHFVLCKPTSAWTCFTFLISYFFEISVILKCFVKSYSIHVHLYVIIACATLLIRFAKVMFYGVQSGLHGLDLVYSFYQRLPPDESVCCNTTLHSSATCGKRATIYTYAIGFDK